MKKLLVTTTVLFLSFTGMGCALADQTKMPTKDTGIYSLKIYDSFFNASEKQCGKLRDKSLEICLKKLIIKDPNPTMLKRSILADSGAKVLAQTAKVMIRSAGTLAALNGAGITIKDLESALNEVSLGVVEGSSDGKSKVILTVKLNEKGRDLITQNLTLELSKGSVIIKGTDAFGRKYK